MPEPALHSAGITVARGERLCRCEGAAFSDNRQNLAHLTGLRIRLRLDPMGPSPGRPPTPLEPDASSAAYLGAQCHGAENLLACRQDVIAILIAR
jgi:hypothetical protein